MKTACMQQPNHALGAGHVPSDGHNLEIIEGKNWRFSKGRLLGKGGFAKCYEVVDLESGEVLAAKIVSKASVTKPRAFAKLQSEIAIHRKLDHDKVVRFRDSFENSEYVYIILELCPNMTLNEFMRKRPGKRLSEPEAMFYLYDLILALKYLHKRRVIHRDLKLGNLFLDADARLKVGDFGLAAQLERDGERRRTLCGTPNYIAPEILEGKHGHSFEVDTWSLGVILYTMLFGRPPFETQDVKTTYRRIRNNQYTFPDSVHASAHAKDLIAGILRTDPLSRPSLDEILAAPWFQSTQRASPAIPPAVSALAAASPRRNQHVGSSSARSETPERAIQDFARIDSPLQHFPFRERSPSSGPAHSAASVPHLQEKAYAEAAMTTPGRHQPNSGRPPLAYKGNEENVAPANMYGDFEKQVEKCGMQNTPIDKIQAVATPYRSAANGINARPTPQSSHVQAPLKESICSGGVRPTIVEVPSAAPRFSTFGRFPSREPSPILGSAGGAGSQPSHRIFTGIPNSTRSSTSSPRSSAPMACGAATLNAAAQRDGRSTRAVSSPGLESGLLGKTTSTSALRGSMGSSPGKKDSQDRLDIAKQQYARVKTPRADADVVTIASRKLVVTPVQAPQENMQFSNRHISSPAQFVSEPAHPEPMTPTLSFPFGDDARKQRNDDAAPITQICAPPCPSWAGAPTNKAPDLWVGKWVDYSSKYGVGYTLSNGCLGVYFNDSTKMIFTGTCFDYITRRTQDKPEIRTTHTFEDYPDDLKKKVTLLRHFKNYLAVDSVEMKDGVSVRESSLPDRKERCSKSYGPGEAPYIKKWTKNKHAILFQLSNKIVQVVFFDKTEAILSSKSHTVTYVDKKGHVEEYPLSSAMDVPNPELAKRLRYTKDILVNLLGVRPADLPLTQ